MLEASKVMSPRHQQTLAAYCDSFADMVEADRELKANGTTIMDDKGRVSNHPAWNRKRDARNQMLKFAAEFGLTASALSRVSAVDQGPQEDDRDSKMFLLEPWQKAYISKLFGTMNGQVRQYRTSLLAIPRKNGKSTLCAGIALKLLFDGEPGAEIYSCAADRGFAPRLNRRGARPWQ